MPKKITLPAPAAAQIKNRKHFKQEFNDLFTEKKEKQEIQNFIDMSKQ